MIGRNERYDVLFSPVTFGCAVVLCRMGEDRPADDADSVLTHAVLFNWGIHLRKLIDLSHTIYHGMATFKGLPGPLICDYLSREASRKNYEEGTEFQIGRIDMVANTGTYIDCPFHRYADGKDLSETDLSRFVDLPGVVVRVPFRDRIEVGKADFQGCDVTGKAVLVQTDWSGHWGTPTYLDNHPFMTNEAAIYLRDQGALLVGIDSHNIDDTRSRNSRPAHTVLLSHEILIVEHLRGLELVPDQGFRFTAVPPKLKGVGTFPVRAFAQVEIVTGPTSLAHDRGRG